MVEISTYSYDFFVDKLLCFIFSIENQFCKPKIKSVMNYLWQIRGFSLWISDITALPSVSFAINIKYVYISIIFHTRNVATGRYSIKVASQLSSRRSVCHELQAESRKNFRLCRESNPGPPVCKAMIITRPQRLLLIDLDMPLYIPSYLIKEHDVTHPALFTR
jgi:hypothetical protein